MTLLAFELPASDAIGQWVLRILAVAGAAAVGGLLLGLVAQGLARLLTTQAIPRVPLQIIRLLGAVASGWVVWILLFHGPGGGGGGGLWPFGGSGAGAGTGKGPDHPATTARGDDTGKGTLPRDTAREQAADGRTLQVEVLAKNPAAYRVAAESRSFTFDELTAYLEARKKSSPDLEELRIVLGEDVLPNVSAVTDLANWAKDHGLTASVSDRPG